MNDDDILARGGSQDDIDSYAESHGATDPTSDTELREAIKAYGDGLTIKGAKHVSDDELLRLISDHTAKAVEEAELKVVINTLNLLNTEPIHTVEQALLGDKEQLEAQQQNTKD